MKSTFVGCNRGSFNVCILKHYERIVTTEFKGRFFHIFTARFSNNLACFVIAYKFDSANASVLDQLMHLILVNENVLKLSVFETPKNY